MPQNRRLLVTLLIVLLFGNGGVLFAAGSGEPPVESYRSELPPPTREYVESEARERYDELLAEFGENKELPTGHELQALLALSHYPELREIRIRFVQEDVGIPISSRPRPISSFRRARNRLYLVVIDTAMEGDNEGREALLLRNQPFNAQVGILGHELAHTAYYLHRTTFGIIGDAVCQLFESCRVEFERDTDVRLIEHNLGWQRYDHSVFVRRSFAAARGEAYDPTEEGGGGAYMSPTQLLRIIDESGLYQNQLQ